MEAQTITIGKEVKLITLGHEFGFDDIDKACQFLRDSVTIWQKEYPSEDITVTEQDKQLPKKTLQLNLNVRFR